MIVRMTIEMCKKVMKITYRMNVVVWLVFCGFAVIASAQTRTLRIVQYNIQDDVSQGSINFVSPLAGIDHTLYRHSIR